MKGNLSKVKGVTFRYDDLTDEQKSNFLQAVLPGVKKEADAVREKAEEVAHDAAEAHQSASNALSYARNAVTSADRAEDALLKAIEAELEIREQLKAPRDAIEFNNGVRIETSDNELHIHTTDLAGGKYVKTFVNSDGDIEAYYAEEAGFAADAYYAEEASYAVSALEDVAGNLIIETYATKEEVGEISAVLEELHAYAQNLISGGETI